MSCIQDIDLFRFIFNSNPYTSVFECERLKAGNETPKNVSPHTKCNCMDLTKDLILFLLLN